MGFASCYEDGQRKVEEAAFDKKDPPLAALAQAKRKRMTLEELVELPKGNTPGAVQTYIELLKWKRQEADGTPLAARIDQRLAELEERRRKLVALYSGRGTRG